MAKLRTVGGEKETWNMFILTVRLFERNSHCPERHNSGSLAGKTLSNCVQEAHKVLRGPRW